MVAGRRFEPGDSYRGVIVNQAMADAYWPGEDPVGRDVIAAGLPRKVVGVVANADTQAESLRLRPVPPRIYWPVILPAVHWVPGILVQARAESVSSMVAVDLLGLILGLLAALAGARLLAPLLCGLSRRGAGSNHVSSIVSFGRS